VHGEHRRAARLRRAGEVLEQQVVLVAGADLGRHRPVGEGFCARAHELLDLARLAQQRGARTGAQRTLRRAAEVEVYERRADLAGPPRALGHQAGLRAHQLQADRCRPAPRAEVLAQRAARQGHLDHARELGERAAERRGRIARQDEVAEARLRDALHRRQEVRGRERQRAGHRRSLAGAG